MSHEEVALGLVDLVLGVEFFQGQPGVYILTGFIHELLVEQGHILVLHGGQRKTTLGALLAVDVVLSCFDIHHEGDARPLDKGFEYFVNLDFADLRVVGQALALQCIYQCAPRKLGSVYRFVVWRQDEDHGVPGVTILEDPALGLRVRPDDSV